MLQPHPVLASIFFLPRTLRCPFVILSGMPLRCTQCATFTARVRKVSLEHERAQLEKAQQEHIKNVRHFRMIQNRLNVLSEASTSVQGDGSYSSGVIKIDCDGLDQAKTKYPRNLCSAKSLSNLWRPQIHVICCVVWGASQNRSNPKILVSCVP